jgi:hypothetical protein
MEETTRPSLPKMRFVLGQTAFSLGTVSFFALWLNSRPEIFPSCQSVISLLSRFLSLFAKVSHLQARLSVRYPGAG